MICLKNNKVSLRSSAKRTAKLLHKGVNHMKTVKWFCLCLVVSQILGACASLLGTSKWDARNCAGLQVNKSFI
jgi:hypothetical protein